MNDVTTAPVTPVDRDAIRAAIFGIKQRSKQVVVAGVLIEVRQPLVQDILQGDMNPDRKQVVGRMLCDYCYVPGTDIRVFEFEDIESIMQIPFGQDWQLLNGTINELSDLGKQMEEAKGNSVATPAA